MSILRKKYLIFYIIINFLILLAGGMRVLASRQENITIENVPLYDWMGNFESDGYFNQNFPVSKYWFTGEAGSLERGVYNVTVFYETNSEHFYLYCDSGTDGNKYPAIFADTYLLDSSQNSLSFQVWVNDKVDMFRVFVECGETDKIPENSYLHFSKIEIDRNFKGTICYEIFKLIMWLCVLNSVLIIYLNRYKIKEEFYVIFGLGIILLASSLEVFTHSQIQGQDLAFHLGRIIGLKESLITGNFPVRIQAGWCNDYGYAASVFYGDIFLYIPAILYSLKVPLVYAYKIYIFIINLGTLFIAYYTFNRISKDKYIGLVSAACYSLSIHRILNVYLRAAVGEYSAFMFLPLIVLGMWEILYTRRERCKSGWIFLALGMTGVIQTHTLSFEMVGIFLAITCIVCIKRVLRKEVLINLCKGSLLTVCLNLGFLIPFMDYAREDLNVFSGKENYGIQDKGLSIYELLAVRTSVTGGANELSFRSLASIGVTMVIILIVAVVLLVKASGWEKEEKRQLTLVLFLSAMALYLSTYYFPWNRIASVKLLRNVVSSIQFPWRFVSIALPLLTLLTCLILMHLKRNIPPNYMKCIMICMCILAAYQGLQWMDMIAKSSGSYVKYDGSQLLDIKATFSGGEYLFEETDIDLALKETDVLGENIQAVHMDKESNQADIWCATGENAYIEVPLFAYPYYQCKDMDTGEIYPITRGSNNKIRIDLPDNYSGNLRISFKEPWHWRMAEAISVLTGILLVVYIFIRNFPSLKYKSLNRLLADWFVMLRRHR